jgi:hypothetical protein
MCNRLFVRLSPLRKVQLEDPPHPCVLGLLTLLLYVAAGATFAAAFVYFDRQETESIEVRSADGAECVPLGRDATRVYTAALANASNGLGDALSGLATYESRAVDGTDVTLLERTLALRVEPLGRLAAFDANDSACVFIAGRYEFANPPSLELLYGQWLANVTLAPPSPSLQAVCASWGAASATQCAQLFEAVLAVPLRALDAQLRSFNRPFSCTVRSSRSMLETLVLAFSASQTIFIFVFAFFRGCYFFVPGKNAAE